MRSGVPQWREVFLVLALKSDHFLETTEIRKAHVRCQAGEMWSGAANLDSEKPPPFLDRQQNRMTFTFTGGNRMLINDEPFYPFQYRLMLLGTGTGKYGQSGKLDHFIIYHLRISMPLTQRSYINPPYSDKYNEISTTVLIPKQRHFPKASSSKRLRYDHGKNNVSGKIQCDD